MLLLGAAPGSHRCYALPTVALPRCRTAAAPLPHRHRGQRPLLLGLDAHRTHIAHIFGACGGVQIGFHFGGNLSGYSCVQNRCSVSSLTRSPTGGAEHLRRSRCLSVSRDSPHSQKRTPTRCPQSLRLAAFSFDLLSHGLPRSSGRLAQIRVSGFSLLYHRYISSQFRQDAITRSRSQFTHGQAHIVVGPSSVSQVHIYELFNFAFFSIQMRHHVMEMQHAAILQGSRVSPKPSEEWSTLFYSDV